MKRRGWLIAIGLVLLYLSPVIYGLIQNLSFSLFGTTDYTDYWERRGQGSGLSSVKKAEAERRPEYASIMLDPDERQRVELLHKYLRTPDPVPVPKIDPRRIIIVDRDMFDDDWLPRRTVNPCSSYRQQPDLSGTYVTIPLTGPNVGDVQINKVFGPE